MNAFSVLNFVEKFNALRLPSPLRNRWIYGVTTAFSAALVWSFFIFVSGPWLGGDIGFDPLIFCVVTLIPTFIAICLFPRQAPSAVSARVLGAAVVLLSFALYSVWVSVLFWASLDYGPFIIEVAQAFLVGVIVFMVMVALGTVMTFGAPWVFALYGSSLFAADDDHVAAEVAQALDDFVRGPKDDG